MKKTLHLNEWLSDDNERQREFPVTCWQTYLAHTQVAPLPHCAAEAMKTYISQASQHGQLDLLHYQIDTETRTLLAHLLDTRSEEVAFTPSAVAGLSTVVAGVDWRPGDSIVLAEHDLLTKAPIWQTLMRRGVRVHLIPARPDAAITVHDVARHLDERTKMVVLSTAHPLTGAPLDIHEISDFVRAKNAWFGVNATDTLGTTHLTMTDVDFLAADTHKWLMAPQGQGILAIRRHVMSQLRPAWLGQYAVPEAYARVAPPYITSESAQRYELSNLNVLGVVGLHASLAMLLEIGIPQIGARLQDLRRFLLAGLTTLNIEPLDDPFCELPRAVTTLRMRDQEARILTERLNEAGIMVSLCADNPSIKAGHSLIRIAPHFYNTFAEIQRLLDMLDRCGNVHTRAVARQVVLS